MAKSNVKRAELPPEVIRGLKQANEAMARVQNPTGLVPVEDVILIKLDPVSEYVGAAQKIIAPDPHKERDQQAMTRATLIAVGGNAFEEWKEPIPKPGDRIVIKKYAGQPAKAGDIEDLYRLTNDNEVVAIET